MNCTGNGGGIRDGGLRVGIGGGGWGGALRAARAALVCGAALGKPRETDARTLGAGG